MQIDTYTPSQVFRTAFAYVDQPEGSLGAGLKHGVNQVCICCKAGSTHTDGQIAGLVDRITDIVDLKPWAEFYTSGTKEYQAYKCGSCGYQWSWYRDKDAS